jgi:predicted nucleic acid-binding protein
MIFCDTSTAAKLYIREPETDAVRERLESEDIVHVSELARSEIMAVFHRRLREGKWTQADFTAAVRQFSADDIAGFWSWLALDAAITDAASKIYVTLPVSIFRRTSDGLHLVTAMHHNFTEIHTHDKHQTAAAGALGLTAVAIASVRRFAPTRAKALSFPAARGFGGGCRRGGLRGW